MTEHIARSQKNDIAQKLNASEEQKTEILPALVATTAAAFGC